MHEGGSIFDKETTTTTINNIHFIYGMIFESLVTIHPSVNVNISPTPIPPTPVEGTSSKGRRRHRHLQTRSLPLWNFIPEQQKINESGSYSHDNPISRSSSNNNYTSENRISAPEAESAIFKSYFIHSRHPNIRMVKYIWPEHLCLQKLFPPTDQRQDVQDDKEVQKFVIVFMPHLGHVRLECYIPIVTSIRSVM